MTMTVNDATEFIYARFKALKDPSWVFTFDSEPFVQPASGSWMRLTVRTIKSAQETLGAPGNREYLRGGKIIVQLFVEADGGRKPADLLAEAIRVMFEGVTFNNIRCYDCAVKEIGNDGKWFNVNAETDFDYNQVK